MKKQFTKIKIAAENLSRSSKSDNKDLELETIEKQVEKYRDVLEKMVRKLPSVSTTADTQEREKRIKKNSHYKIGQALEESCKDLSKDMPLQHVLGNCGELEKSLAECIVDCELETELEVVKRLKLILDNEIQEIATLKRNVSRTLQEYASLKRNYEAAIRLDEPQSKINHIKEQQEECEAKLEKERDAWAAQMFELIAKEDVIVQCIRDYVLNQRNYHERALQKVNQSLAGIQDIIQSTVKSRFGTSLHDHLESSKRHISHIIELCVCCLIESGLREEGILRVGCGNTKLRRMKRALEAQYVKTPLPLDYQDPHVIGSILKLYLRELPEPILTFKCYKDFKHAADCNNENDRKAEIKATLAKLPAENYANLRYLTKFLWLVTQHVEYNKMSSQNLAIVMSPNMLWPRIDKNSPADYVGQVNSSSAVNAIVELLIREWDYFFEGDVDFYVTLQRGKLFVEGKSKSSSSSENLDKHESDSIDSPRYGTLKRQKPCAPSPPSKGINNGNGTSAGEVSHHHRNGDVNHRPHMKDLFPPAQNNNSIMTNSTSSIGSNSSANAVPHEKPEKPPLPKVLQLQQVNSNAAPIIAPAPVSAKPVPMTRTQFFGLDNLPSPISDRKSSDSTGSVGQPKPDLPQKPKIPKRPVALGLNTGHKSDDEVITPTSHPPNSSFNNSSNETKQRRNSTDKFLERLRQETNNGDNGDIRANNEDKISMTTSFKDNHSQQLLNSEQKVSNLGANDKNANTTEADSRQSINGISIESKSVKYQPIPAQQSDSATIATSTSAATTTITAPAATNVSNTQPRQQQATPTTPISPNNILTPKRPTVPAPPPPCVVKKQTAE